MSNSISFNSIIQHNEMIRKRNICCIYYGTRNMGQIPLLL